MGGGEIGRFNVFFFFFFGRFVEHVFLPESFFDGWNLGSHHPGNSSEANLHDLWFRSMLIFPGAFIR